MTCPTCDGDGYDGRYVESCPKCKGSGKVSAKRYCGPCDRWVPASEYECKACGADTDKAEPEDERDEDYERANLRWRDDHGGEL